MTNKEAAKILRGMVDCDFRKKKNTALTMGWTALRDVDEAKQKIVELADTCDKLNTLVTKYREALDIAADNYEDAANCSYQKFRNAHTTTVVVKAEKILVVLILCVRCG